MSLANTNSLAVLRFWAYSSAEPQALESAVWIMTTHRNNESSGLLSRWSRVRIPLRPPTLFSPVRSANYSRGLTSGLRQRQGFLHPLSFWTHLPRESKVQNDLSLLPDRMPEIRKAR